MAQPCGKLRPMRRLVLPLGLLWTVAGCPSDDAPSDASSGGTTGADATTETEETGSTGQAETSGSSEASSSSGEGDASSTGDPEQLDYEPVLLDCAPGSSFPFETESSGFANPDAEAVATDNPRIKDASSDLMGNPGGPFAYTTLPNEQAVGQTVAYEGERARTANDAGLTRTPLPGEAVSLWRYDGEAWSQLDRQMTDDAGLFSFADAELSNNNAQPLYSVLEADQSCTPHYTWLLEPGTPFIITDIDGTLTLSDDELFMQASDGDYDPLMKGAAVELMQAWAAKGYTIVYMTARPHLLRAETRAWLDAHDFPAGPLISSNSLAVGGSALVYKSAWGTRLLSDFGWSPVAAYGNADTDIGAYDAAGIPKEITFIIGELAGTENTMPIADDDYTDHIAEFVDPYPDA